MTPHPRLWSSVALAVAAGLTACATGLAQPLAPTRTSESPAAVDVTVARRVLSVHFQPGALTPAPGQIEAFNGLLAAGDVSRGDRIVIERGPAVLADARTRVLAVALTREGLRPSVVEAGDVAESELRLVVEHATARVPGCPDWSKPPGNDFANTLHGDFGCATAGDLAAMVADPRDLVEGRPLAPVVGDAAIFAIHRYRTGAPESSEATVKVSIPSGQTTVASAPTKPHDAAASQPAASVPPPVPAGPGGAIAQAGAAIAAGGDMPK